MRERQSKVLLWVWTWSKKIVCFRFICFHRVALHEYKILFCKTDLYLDKRKLKEQMFWICFASTWHSWNIQSALGTWNRPNFITIIHFSIILFYFFFIPILVSISSTSYFIFSLNIMKICSLFSKCKGDRTM